MLEGKLSSKIGRMYSYGGLKIAHAAVKKCLVKLPLGKAR
jgi:hypothetical protein